MGNTHLRLPTRESLREYADEHGHKSLDDAVVALLAEHRELLATQRECELLHRLFEPVQPYDRQKAKELWRARQ